MASGATRGHVEIHLCGANRTCPRPIPRRFAPTGFLAYPDQRNSLCKASCVGWWDFCETPWRAVDQVCRTARPDSRTIVTIRAEVSIGEFPLLVPRRAAGLPQSPRSVARTVNLFGNSLFWLSWPYRDGQAGHPSSASALSTCEVLRPRIHEGQRCSNRSLCTYTASKSFLTVCTNATSITA